MSGKTKPKNMNQLIAPNNPTLGNHNGLVKSKMYMALSDRETEILQLAAQGHSTPQIADKVFLSIDTIESHRKSIIRKMGAKNITESVAIALRNKWIE